MTGDERGATTLEFVVLVPVVMIMLALAVAGGRLWLARAAVVDAAEGAARAATLARTVGAATTAAHQTADATLSSSGVRCRPRDLALDTSGFAKAAGTSSSVTATITCQVPLGDIALPGLPGSIRVHHSAVSALDTFRERR